MSAWKRHKSLKTIEIDQVIFGIDLYAPVRQVRKRERERLWNNYFIKYVLHAQREGETSRICHSPDRQQQAGRQADSSAQCLHVHFNVVHSISRILAKNNTHRTRNVLVHLCVWSTRCQLNYDTSFKRSANLDNECNLIRITMANSCLTALVLMVFKYFA